MPPHPGWTPLLLAGLLCAGTAGSALAQGVPAAQLNEQLLQQEREREQREKQERRPDVRLFPHAAPEAAERLPHADTHCVNITRIRLIGDAADQFQWALQHVDQLPDGTPDPAVGRCLGTQGLNLVMRRMQNALIAKGYTLARVLLGPQKHLSEGILELTLFPGRIRRIEFAPGTDGRATAWNAFPIGPGDLLNLRDIEQALENFKRIPSAEAEIEFRATEGDGAAPGQTDVIVKWKQGFPIRLSLFADDSGTRATGKYQGSVTLSFDHWWALNDMFYFSVNHDLGSIAKAGSRGTQGYTAHYSIPFGYWMLGLTSSRNRYRQAVAGIGQTYIYEGTSQDSEIRLSRVIHRDATGRTSASLVAWTRRSSNFIDDTEIQVQRRRMAGWGLGVSHRQFLGAAVLELNLNYRRGTGAWGSLHAPEEAFGEGTARPQILTADVSLNVPFRLDRQAFRYSATLRGQWNGTRLVPQDRFAIGSRYTVRGFDGRVQLVAERGWLIRNDLGWSIGETGQELYLGIDHGRVAGPSRLLLPGNQLSGFVVGLRGSIKGFSYNVFAGKPLSKPRGFQASDRVAGFNAAWSF